ncbi:MAG: NUDIX domain-containing protein [Candidatus Pacearchaeota archaeon]|nr:NUDIX domain-containing protein [Candidatus Pacearchaeota archaeon]
MTFQKKKKAKYQLSCGVIIFHIQDSKPQFLLVKYPTYWGFVKGKVEPGEDEEMTAFREALEEVGLKDLRFITGFRKVAKMYFLDPYDKSQLIRKEAVFLLTQTHEWNVKISSEHQDFKWCTFEKALALIEVKGVKKLLADANLFIEKNFDLNLGILKNEDIKRV